LRSPHPETALAPERTANTGRFLGEVRRVAGGRLLVATRRAPRPGDRLRVVARRGEHQAAFVCRAVAAGKAGTVWIEGLAAAEGRKTPPAGPFGPGDRVFKVDEGASALLAGHRPLPAPRDRRGRGRRRKAARERAETALADYRSAAAGAAGRPRGPARPELWAAVRDPAAWREIQGLRPDRLVVEINRRTLAAFLRHPPFPARTGRLLWALPPVLHEERLAFHRSALRRILAAGFAGFVAANLSHPALIREAAGEAGSRRVEIHGGAGLNILNSLAVRAAGELGLASVQLSVESDRDNLEALLAAGPPLPAGLTVYGYLPLFTTRMRHPAFRPGTPVVSPKGERLHWTADAAAGHLLPARPFSLLDKEKELRRLALSAWVLDFTHRPPRRRGPGRLRSRRDLDRLERGWDWNFSGRLR
ncbi:hypothetical protein G3N55_10665, partial [Dissulfurirhabdus thermomarina]|nr:hypothetical protein [Dissulfurirhabdus thermomarina]